jgi:hypothetical protein
VRSPESQLCRLVSFGSAALNGRLDVRELNDCWDFGEGSPRFQWYESGKPLQRGESIARNPEQFIRWCLDQNCSQFEFCSSESGDDVIPDTIAPLVGSIRLSTAHFVTFVQVICTGKTMFFAPEPQRIRTSPFQNSISDFVGAPAKTHHVQTSKDIGQAAAALRRAIRDVDAFFQSVGTTTKMIPEFDTALQLLEAPVPHAQLARPDFYDELVPRTHPLEARQLIAAGATAATPLMGGGMGSWYDRFYRGEGEQERFRAVSSALRAATSDARLVGVNAVRR